MTKIPAYRRRAITAEQVAHADERFRRGELVFVWHFNHDKPFGILGISLSERVRQIKTNKPKREHAIRLGLIREARGISALVAPEWERANTEWRRANAEWERANTERQRANTEWQRAYAEWQRANAEWQRANAEWRRAYTELQRARIKWERTSAEWWRENAPTLLALHDAECGCGWDGKDIMNLIPAGSAK